MTQKTPLYDRHQQLNALLVPFAGWDMPLHYGSQMEEHHAVRRDAGMFDVSHMAVIDVAGPDATAYLRYLLANDVAKLKAAGRALYTCLLNASAGIIDDLLVYKRSESDYRLVVNASTREKDTAWLLAHVASFAVSITPRPDMAILAVQGPNAIAKAQTVFANYFTAEEQAAIAALKYFYGSWCGDCLIARTGYTGESGYEMIIPARDVGRFWDALLAAGVRPCGLGARDTLRLEAGLNLYGTDMTDAVTPWESNLAWTVALAPESRDFIGRGALEASTPLMQLVGLVLVDRGVLRAHQRVVTDQGEGEVTGGTFSPTLNCSIAFARVPVGAATHCTVDIRGRLLRAKIVATPFVKQGKATFDVV